jgi:hypothetical protein
MIELHTEVLDSRTEDVLAKLGSAHELASFYLAGGTGLALQLGHRRSNDLDLFSERPWRWETTQPGLASAGRVGIDRQEAGTFVGKVDGVRVSLFHYPYVLLEPTLETRFQVPVAGLLDIACMKVVAVVQRGGKKDFIDLYHLSRAGFTVEEVLAALSRKVPGSTYSRVAVAKGLAYFDDADEEPEPEMLVPSDWTKIKRFWVDEAAALL